MRSPIGDVQALDARRYKHRCICCLHLAIHTLDHSQYTDHHNLLVQMRSESAISHCRSIPATRGKPPCHRYYAADYSWSSARIAPLTKHLTFYLLAMGHSTPDNSRFHLLSEGFICTHSSFANLAGACMQNQHAKLIKSSFVEANVVANAVSQKRLRPKIWLARGPGGVMCWYKA